MADLLYCVSGGNYAENGFLVDIEAEDLAVCMGNNYFASAYAAQSMLKIWTEDDKKLNRKAHVQSFARLFSSTPPEHFWVYRGPLPIHVSHGNGLGHHL